MVDQLKRAALNLKDKITKSPFERLLKESTSNENWNVPNKTLQEIADHSYNHNDFTLIMKHIWKRLNSQRKKWRKIIKTLALIDFLLKNGSPRCISEIKDEIYQIRTLQDFSHFENGQDKGAGIREKSKQIIELLNNEEKLDQEREQAKKLREKLGFMQGFGNNSQGNDYNSKYKGSYSGYGSESVPSKMQGFGSNDVKNRYEGYSGYSGKRYDDEPKPKNWGRKNSDDDRQSEKIKDPEPSMKFNSKLDKPDSEPKNRDEDKKQNNGQIKPLPKPGQTSTEAPKLTQVNLIDLDDAKPQTTNANANNNQNNSNDFFNWGNDNNDSKQNNIWNWDNSKVKAYQETGPQNGSTNVNPNNNANIAIPKNDNSNFFDFQSPTTSNANPNNNVSNIQDLYKQNTNVMQTNAGIPFGFQNPGFGFGGQQPQNMPMNPQGLGFAQQNNFNMQKQQTFPSNPMNANPGLGNQISPNVSRTQSLNNDFSYNTTNNNTMNYQNQQQLQRQMNPNESTINNNNNNFGFNQAKPANNKPPQQQNTDLFDDFQTAKSSATQEYKGFGDIESSLIDIGNLQLDGSKKPQKQTNKAENDIDNLFPSPEANRSSSNNSFGYSTSNPGPYATNFNVGPGPNPAFGGGYNPFMMGQQMPMMGQQMPMMGQQLPMMGPQMQMMGQQIPMMNYNTGMMNRGSNLLFFI